MAKLFRRLGDLLRGKPKVTSTIVPPVYPPQPEPQPVARKAAAPPRVAAGSAEPPTMREPAVATEPAVPREPGVPGP